MFGKAEIFPEYVSEMWAAPYQSLIEGDGNEGYVFVTNDLEKANKVKVNIFDLEKDTVLINHGLDNYKYLIVSGSAYLNDNSQIKIDNK